MTLRRDFFKRLAVGVGGLLVADDALELIARPRRKYWQGHSWPDALRSGWVDVHVTGDKSDRWFRLPERRASNGSVFVDLPAEAFDSGDVIYITMVQ